MGPIMDGDFAKLFAGQMGVCAVVLNVLIDKGVITQDELRARFERAQDAAAHSSGGIGRSGSPSRYRFLP